MQTQGTIFMTDQEIKENIEVGKIISKYLYKPSDKETAFIMYRHQAKHNNKKVVNPYLMMAKELCKISKKNCVARGFIRIFCDQCDFSKQPYDLMIFRDFYVQGLTSKEIIEKYRDTCFPGGVSGSEYDSHKTQVMKIIERVNRSFAIYLAGALPLIYEGAKPYLPDDLPCKGHKNNQRSDCPTCFFNTTCPL